MKIFFDEFLEALLACVQSGIAVPILLIALFGADSSNNCRYPVGIGCNLKGLCTSCGEEQALVKQS
ncbi:hypothetical protein DRP53_10670 [candidate division WOR-3 bacterium]|uniref:Uncharacterized protein n=1 Tax=candidate division WOR-3 bacterium TaxID=2052148 RepID=A0A660SD54_UNCW3|nr:MAG: hypothetical protein DRP53_10670 [candidate division WOR-3 bacterium]